MQNYSERIYTYLQSIYPQGATNAEIDRALQMPSIYVVNGITRALLNQERILGVPGVTGQRSMTFYARSPEETTSPLQLSTASTSKGDETGVTLPQEFQQRAAEFLSRRYGKMLSNRSLPLMPKSFELVSDDVGVVGCARYFPRNGGPNLQAIRLAIITEAAWLLERTSAENKFILFGGDRATPFQWLQQNGLLCPGIKLYFLFDNGNLEELKLMDGANK